MHEDDFEEMSCALLSAEPGVHRAELYRSKFDKQFGIDAFGETDAGQVVVSCKCYENIRKGQMKTWSEDFLKHWDAHWKSKNVRKFILSVACEARSEERLADIEVERARFAKIGVEYEVWSARQLQELLRPQRGIVSQYLPHFVDIICGTVETVKQSASPADLNAADIEKRLSDLIAVLSAQFKAELDRCKNLLSAGRLAEVEAVIAGLRDSAAWRSLDPHLQARGVRLLGSVAISRQDIEGAQKLSDEADLLAPAEEPRLKALIALNREGVSAALQVLGIPKTEAGWEMKASLHYVESDLEAGDSALANLPQTSSEYFRLLAYSHLLRSNAEEAKVAIEAALKLSPDAVVVKRTSAMTKYALALSPRAPPYALVQPQPIDWFLVKRDDASTAFFREARETFAHISETSETPSVPSFEDIWVLACDCNLGDLESARIVATDLLGRDPVNALVIAWVRSRRVGVDLEASFLALMAKLRDGTLDENGPSCLEWTVTEKDRGDLLEAAKARLVLGVENERLREELEELVQRLDDPTWSDNPIVMAMMRANDAGSDELEKIIGELASQTPTPPIITAVAGVLGDLGRWSLVVDYAELLLSFQTADIVRLVARAAYYEKNAALASQIFSQHADKFPGARLPFELQRMEAEALLQSGQAPEALRRADALVAQQPSPTAQLWLADVRAGIGDHQFAVPILQQAIEGGNLSPDRALEWSQRLVGEKPKLARDLWRHALKHPLEDRLVLPAWHIGRLLGVVGEAPELMGSIHRLAQAGDRGVWMITADELPQALAAIQSKAGEAYTAWTAAEVPVHLAVGATNGNLAQLYDFDRTGELQFQPILCRHGARASVFFATPGPAKPGFVVDVTGLMVADQCDLLDLLLDNGHPLYVGSTTAQALLAMEQSLQTDDPGPVDGHEAVLKAIGRGVEVGRILGALVVSPTATPGDTGVADIESVRAALISAGFEVPVIRSEVDAQSAFGVVPEPGQTLLFTFGTLSQLASEGALPTLISTFDIRIDEGSLLFASETVHRRRESQRVGAWIRKLRTFVAQAVTDGRITLIDQTKIRTGDGGDIDADDNPIAANLMEVLLASEARGETLVWIEDRYVTGFATTGQTNVVCAFDILMELRRTGGLSHDEYFARLLRLRSGGCLFLPFRSEELHYHLSRAAVRDGNLIETAELSTLARSIGLHALYDGHLRIGLQEGDPPGRPNERQALLDLRKVAEDLIIEVWNSDAPVEIIQARADWIWKRLRTDLYYRDPENGPQPATLSLAAMTIAHFVSSVFSMAIGRGFGRRQRRKDFLEWVSVTVIGDRFERDLALRQEFGRLVRQFFSIDQVLGGPLSSQTYQMALQINRMVIAQCPPRIRDVILDDQRFASSIGMARVTIIELQRQEFDSDRFFRAASRAVNYGKAHLRTKDRRKRATFKMDRSSGQLLLGGCLKGEMPTGQFAALARSVRTDRGDLHQTLLELDLPKAEWSTFADRLGRQPAASARIKMIDELREHSVSWFLANLFSRIEKRERFEVAAFAPLHFSNWLAYLRWSGTTAGTVVALTNEFGANEAMARLGGLPIDLTGQVSVEDGRAAFVSPSPVGLIHRLRMLADSGADVRGEISECLRYIFEAFTLDGQLFSTLLTWGAQHFEAQEGWSDLPVEAKHAVVWTYADKITEIFQRVGGDGAAVEKIFKNNAPVFRPDLLFRVERGYNDCPAYHDAVTPDRLLLAGLEYAIGTTIDHTLLAPDIPPALIEIIGTEREGGERTVPLHPAYPWNVPGPETWLNRPNAGTLFENGEPFAAVFSKAVEELDLDPNDLNAFYQVILFGGVAYTEEVAERIKGAMQRSDLGLLIALDTNNIVLKLFGILASRLDDEAASVVRQKIAVYVKAKYRVLSKEAFGKLIMDVVEAVSNACRLRDGSGCVAFSTFIADLAVSCPDAASRLEPITYNLVNLVPIAAVESFWKSWLKVKSSRAA